MKATCVLSAVLGLVSSASAHYTFDKIDQNGKRQGGDNTYIRRHENGYMPTKFKGIPNGSISPNDPDFTCNKNSKPAPMVLKVKAGDKIALKQAFGGTGMAHPGTSQMYLGPVANAAADMPTDWYLVSQSLLCNNKPPSFCSYGEDNINFVVPSTIPNGQYLARGEHIAVHGAQVGEMEFYYACAQIEVTGNTATTMPGTAVKIPGVYKPEDTAFEIDIYFNFKGLKAAPGPGVIPGGTTRGSLDGSGGGKTVTVGGGGSGSGSGSPNGDDSKPEDSKPEDSKPDDSKSGDSKPAPSKPAPSKPAPSKPVSSKSDDSKSDGSKSGSKPANC